jgi:biotin carboxylase
MSGTLLICPTHRDLRELRRISPRLLSDLHTFEYASDAMEALTAPCRGRAIAVDRPRDALEAARRAADAYGVDAVLSTDDYPGVMLAAILADDFSQPGPPPRSTALSQHKAAARDVQRVHAPDCVPAYQAVASAAQITIPMPFIVKPVKSFFSAGATPVNHAAHVSAAVDGATLPTAFFDPFNIFAQESHAPVVDERRVIAEGLLTGRQVTLEGYAWRGEVHTIGIVDSVMFPGTMAFRAFEYPSCLPLHVQARMSDAATRVMRGLGFGHGLFNIEFIYNDTVDSIGLVEINPRMSSQFADLFEKVDGTNTYQVLVDLAFGIEPHVRWRRGRHAFAASCVLRTFVDHYVAAMPRPSEVDQMIESDPDLRVELLADVGTRLSEAMQDVSSYRYGVINAGGRDRQDVEEIVERCLHHLTIELYPM